MLGRDDRGDPAGHDDTGRMFQGNLCLACFREENSEWFVLKHRLRAEIEARGKLLRWSEIDGSLRKPTLAPVPDVDLAGEIF